MITWIQKTFQQHFRIIFLVLLAVVIVSFIFVTNTSGGFGRRDRHAAARPFYGIDLSDEQDVTRLQRDARISDILTTGGRRPDNILEQYGHARHAMLYKANELQIPAPSETELKAFIQRIPVFQSAPQSEGGAPTFNGQLYEAARLNPAGLFGIPMTPADFKRIITEDARIEAAYQVLVGPGYALPGDIQQLLKQLDTSWTIQTASIDRDSLKLDVTPGEIDLVQFFSSNQARYVNPPRVRASYVKVNASAFADNTTPIDEKEARSVYDSNPSLFPKPENTAPATLAAPSTPENDFAQVKGKVETYIRNQRAVAKAYEAAQHLASKLYAAKITLGSPDLEKFRIEANASAPEALPEFSVNDIPAVLGQNHDAIVNEVFRANFGPQKSITNAIPTEDGAVVLFWQQTTPARQLDLKEAKEKVTADFIAQEKQKKFAELGPKLKSDIQAALKAGSKFEDAVTKAATASGLTATTKVVPAFTLRTTRSLGYNFYQTASGELLDANTLAALETLEKGDISDMSILGASGRITYIQDKQLPDLSETNPNYAATARDIASRNSTIAREDYVRNLVKTAIPANPAAPEAPAAR